MPEITFDLNGILKLLSNLKHDKASGPDEIKSAVLKELRNEIATIVQRIFEKSLASGNNLLIGPWPMSAPYLKRPCGHLAQALPVFLSWCK